VPGIEKRARACLEMGFTSLIGPGGEAPGAVGFSAVEVVGDAVRIAFASAPSD